MEEITAGSAAGKKGITVRCGWISWVACGVVAATAVAAPPPPAWRPVPAEAIERHPGPDRFTNHILWTEAALGGLKSKDADVRARSAFVLGQIGNPRAQRALRRLLNDRAAPVRRHAGIALLNLDNRRGLDEAKEALQEAPRWVRYYAAEALARSGLEQARGMLRLSRFQQEPYIQRCIGDFLIAPPEKLVAVPAGEDEEQWLPEDLGLLFIEAGNILAQESDAHFHLGDYDAAIRCNEAVAFLDPENVEAWTNAAWLLWSMNRDDEAVMMYNRGIAANPDKPDVYFEFGMFRFARKRYELAVELFKRAAQRGARVQWQRMVGHSLERAGLYDEALEWWAGLLQRFPGDPIAARKLQEAKGKQNK